MLVVVVVVVVVVVETVVETREGHHIIPIEIQDSKDTRDSSFSAKSSRHFESRSSLHVSDLAALTIM